MPYIIHLASCQNLNITTDSADEPDYCLSTDPLEGTNNKIKTMQKKACD
jgi:hypothetical protein